MKFSINIPYGLKDWQAYFDIFYTEYFYGIELPADYLNSGNIFSLIKKYRYRIVNVIDLMELSIIRNAALQDDFVKEDIFEHINEIIIKKRNFKIDSFLLDLGFNTNDKNSDETALRLNFFKKFAFSLYKKDLYATIPVSINSEFDLKKHSEYFLNIIQNSMYHLFKLSLNISPHDLKSSILPSEIYKNFIFNIKNIRLIYEPDTGNYLTEKIFLYWLEALNSLNFSGDIIIVPKTTNDYIYENEVKKITTIIENLKISLS